MELFTSLQGRIGRQSFWIGIVGLIIANIVLGMIMSLLGFSVEFDPVTGEMSGSFWASTLIPTLILLWPSICVIGKRFHDRNKSALWYLITFVPIVGFFWILIECGFLKGTEGSNNFGPDPVA